MKYLTSRTAVFLYACLTFGFIAFQFNESGIIFWDVQGNSLANTVMPGTFMVLGIMMVYQRLLAQWKCTEGKIYDILAAIVSMFFSFMTFMGKYYAAKINTGLFQILKQGNGILKAGICFIGGCLLFFFVFLGLGILGSRNQDKKEDVPKTAGKIQFFLFGRYSFLKVFLVMGICWLPHLIIRYPGAGCTDSFNSLAQYYGLIPYTTQHPIIYTLLLGKMTDLGIAMGDGSYGLYALILLQTVSMLVILSYTIQTMRKFQVPFWCCSLSLVIFCISPNIVAFVTTAIIDAPYSAASVLLMVELCYYLFAAEEYKKSRKHLLLTFLAVAGSFFRYNGIYMIAIVIVLTVFRELFLLLKKQQKIRYSVIILLVLLVPAAAGKVGVSYLNQKYETTYTSKRAKYGIQMQQIARYMIYHGDDVTSEEMETIQKVLKWDVEDYKERYTPYKIDGVKGGFNNDATSEEIHEFLKVWIKLFFRHPVTYVEATVQQNYLLFSPLADNCRYYENAQDDAVKNGKYDFSELYKGNSEKENWTSLQQKLMDYYYGFTQAPILGMIVNRGWYSLLLMGICLWALCRKNWRMLFLGMPLLLTLAVAFVGPAIYGNQRYVFPIMYSMPLFFGMFLCGDQSDDDRTADTDRCCENDLVEE